MFGIGGSEFLIIAVIVVMLFGPDKLPKLARTIGRFMSEFKRYQAMMESTIRAEMYLTEEPADPFKKAGEYQDKLRAEKEAAEESDSGEVDAAVSPAAETPATEPEAAEYDEDDEVPIAPEDAGWVPGTPGAPGVECAGEVGEEAEERS